MHPASHAAADQAVRRPLFRGSLLGMLVSVAIHVTILLIAASILVSGPAGSGPGENEGVELAVLTDAELTEMTEQAQSSPVSSADLAASA